MFCRVSHLLAAIKLLFPSGDDVTVYVKSLVGSWSGDDGTPRRNATLKKIRYNANRSSEGHLNKGINTYVHTT